MNKFESTPGHPPFSSDLVNDELFGTDKMDKEKLKVLEDDPHIVVRLDSRENALEYGQTAQRLYQEFAEECPAISLPKIQQVMGEYEGEPTLFTLVERVEGRGIIDQLKNPSTKFLERLTELYSALPLYYVKKLQNGESALSDIYFLDQYRHGYVKSNPAQNKLYLVDFDPFYGKVVLDKEYKLGIQRKGPGVEHDIHFFLLQIIGQLHKLSAYRTIPHGILESYDQALHILREEYRDALSHSLPILEEGLQRLRSSNA